MANPGSLFQHRWGKEVSWSLAGMFAFAAKPWSQRSSGQETSFLFDSVRTRSQWPQHTCGHWRTFWRDRSSVFEMSSRVERRGPQIFFITADELIPVIKWHWKKTLHNLGLPFGLLQQLHRLKVGRRVADNGRTEYFSQITCRHFAFCAVRDPEEKTG